MSEENHNDENNENPIDSPEEKPVDPSTQAEEEQPSDGESGQSETTGDEAGEENIVARLEAELSEAKDQALRAAAEMQNVRHRAERDVEKAHKFAVEKFSTDMVDVADNLERAILALDADEDSHKPVIEGIELTLKSLLDIFAKHNIEQIDPHGEPFDPQVHEAMTMVPNPAMEPNTVMDVMEKGYTLNGRLIRPARVVVTKEG